MLTGLQFTNLKRPSFLSLFIGLFITLSNTVCAQAPNASTTPKSGFAARLVNIEAPANETFRYNATLTNGASQPLVYEFHAKLPSGWQISYRVDGSLVTSLRMEAGKVQDVGIEVNSTLAAKPGKYNIPIQAISAQDTLLLDLEAVVKGSYAVELTTPSGRLSDEVVSGGSKDIKLVVKNTGTLPLNSLDLSSQLPSKWEVTFEPANIKQLEPGQSMEVKASVQVPEKTIAGDYVAKLSVKNPNAQAELSFRTIVKTSLLSGWIGIVIILLAIGLVYYLIRKYGRR
ncbi:MAG TPA: NEW3 domain-containing protein [Sphingobacterium sp.]|jgi:uncharacterized membrane protein|nr:NEW3 domain-containing protein [Sphingobacterium sp.]